MNGVIRHHTAESIYEEALRLALGPENMYFTHLALKANGEDRSPTAVEAMIHFLNHGGYEKTLRYLGVSEYPLTVNSPPQERAQMVRSD